MRKTSEETKAREWVAVWVTDIRDLGSGLGVRVGDRVRISARARVTVGLLLGSRLG